MAQKSTIVRMIQGGAPMLSRVAPGLAAQALERLFLTPLRHATPEREKPWIANAWRTSIPFDEERALALYAWGQGPTILLVHGWAGRASQLAVYAEPLAARGFRVVAFDAPAHGHSTGKRTALPEFAAAIERVAEAVGPLHGIVSHSIGTAATTLALSRGLAAQRLVYLSPPDRPCNYLDRAASWLGFPEPVTRETQRRIERRFEVRFADADGPPLAAALDNPLLVVHDRDDTDVPYREGEALAAAWPGSVMKTTTGLGHTRIIRDEEVVRAVVEFISRSRPVRAAG